MSTFSARKFMNRLVAAAALVSLVAAGSTLVRAADDVPEQIREGIEAALKKKVSDLSNEKNSEGFSFKRGTYSKSFRKQPDGTYLVGFEQSTIEPVKDGAGDEMKTERFELTLKKGDGQEWKIAKEDLKDTYVGLFRPVVSDAWTYSFDKLSFDHEGLKVTATNGYLYEQRLKNEVTGFAVFADDLKYDYAPPADVSMPWYDALEQKIASDHPEDLVFKPERLGITCDPTTCQAFMGTVFTGLKALGGGGTGGGSASGGEALGKMKDRLDEVRKKDEKERKENPFGGLTRRPDPDARSWSFIFKRASARDHYASLSYYNFAPWQMSFYVTGYGRLFAYYSEDVRGKVPPYVLETRDDLDARDYDLTGLKGTVDIGLEDPTAMKGDITFTMRIKRRLRELPFAISRLRFSDISKETKSPNLFINSVQDGDGNELTWCPVGTFGGLVVLPEPVDAGTILKIRLQYTNYNSIYQINPSFAFLDRGGWLPFVRFGDFIDDFDLTTRLPDKYQVLGVGDRASETDENGIRTTRWTSKSPVTFPTVIFGDYISGNAGDCKNCKATKTDGTVIPVNVYVDRGSTAGMTDFEGLTSGARDIRGKQLKAIATQATVALNLYRDTYGIDYPFAKLDLVADPLGDFYGQSPASIVYLGFGVFRGEGTVGSSLGAGASTFNKDVVAHEVGHQWWGGLITNANFRNYWFVESMAEVSAAVYVDTVFGHKKYLEKVDQWRRVIMNFSPEAPVQDGYTVWSGSDPRAAIANIYNKGPYAFHMFRETFGDKKFFQLLKTMAQKLAHKEIVTRDIEDVMEEVVGGNMDWFFDQWIRGVGLPQYALFWTKRQNEKGQWIVEGTVKQRVVFGKDKTPLKGVYYRAVAPLTFVDANGKEYKSASKLLVQGPETPFRVIIGVDPLKVYFNKDGEILAEDGLVNQSW